MCLPWKGSWGQETGEHSEKVIKGPSHLTSQVSQTHMWYVGVYLCGSIYINTRVFSSWKLYFQPLITIKTLNIEKLGWKLITILFSPYLDPQVLWLLTHIGLQCFQKLYIPCPIRGFLEYSDISVWLTGTFESSGPRIMAEDKICGYSVPKFCRV